MAGGPELSSPQALRDVRSSRRRPRITQYDYLHLRALVDSLRSSLARVEPPVRDVLDVWCGSRPYDDLLPAGARCVGLDVEGNPYGVADVVSDELLPFEDESFDLVFCVQAFQYMPDPVHVVSEFRRVLRPGGTALVTLVFGFEYNRRSAFEGRYTEHQLRDLFAGWDAVAVREDGGRTVSWTVLTGSLAYGLEQRLSVDALHPLFAGFYALVNAIGLALGRAERDGDNAAALPMNLTVVARKPAA